MTPEERVRAAADRYDDTGVLAEQALAALARRAASSGKVCAVCALEKPLSAFGPDTRKVDGLKSTCRPCVAERDRAYRAAARA